MTKDEALEKAIWMLETIDEGKRVYETRMIAETIWACKEALTIPEPFIAFSQKEWMAALAAAGQQQPLSDDEIENILDKHYPDEFFEFARAIEQAHGIGGKND